MSNKTIEVYGKSNNLFAVVLIILLSGTHIHAQKTISLRKENINPGPLNFNVIEVVDGREVKAIGTVMKGLRNKVRWAEFDRGTELEIMDLIIRSGACASGSPEIIMRINKLNISEASAAWEEQAVTELSVDFFFALDNQFYYITSRHANKRSKSMEATYQHRTNIALAVEEVLMAFNKYNLEQHVINEPPISMNQVAQYQLSLADKVYPILVEESFSEGIFSDVTEFRENNPLIVDGYEVVGELNPVIYWLDEKGNRVQRSNYVFALAYGNNLFFNFNSILYPIEKHGDSLIFFGDDTVNPGHFTKGFFWAGILGAAVAQSGETVRMVYKIDLETGGVKELGYAR
jgi:hypothetical protein